jgi:uncharacterized repeat protein (TIGR03803 family)
MKHLFLVLLGLLPVPLQAQTFSTLYSFPSEQLGAGVSSVVLTKSGVIFAGLVGGGAQFQGAIVALVPTTAGSYDESVLYSFTDTECGNGGGCDPWIIQGPSGSLYGTVRYAGQYKMGQVFSLAPPAKLGEPWTYTALYTFTGGADSGQPMGGLIEGGSGQLYGATYGPTYPTIGGPGRWGNVFELVPQGESWTYTSVHIFEGPDGGNPVAGLTMGRGGSLYGTTLSGGSANGGVVFELAPPTEGAAPWTETVLHSFSFANGDGVGPSAPVTLGATGVLYGTTYAGGSANAGTVFALYPPTGSSTAWTERILHSFNNSHETDGFNPYLPVTIGPGGVLYGTSANGGIPANYGVVYSLTPPARAGEAWTETMLTNFVGSTLGANPSMGFVYAGGGNLITATTFGGTGGWGTILELIP